jgi:hypothetical protein
MSGPFSRSPAVGTPQWGELAPPASTFIQVNVLGAGYEEVGYGEGGYGEGGYDAPSISAQAAPEPDWTIGSLR